MKVTPAALLVCCLALGCSRPEVHLIPAGYKGDVVIMPGYPMGVPPKRDGLSIVFDIPHNGILVTQDQPSSRWHTEHYYYVDGSGRRQRLQEEYSTVHDTPANRADTTPIVAMITGTGEERGVDIPCTIYAATYYVGTRADLLSRSVDQANAQRRRIEQLVRRDRVCR
jgi:hypothetical protein